MWTLYILIITASAAATSSTIPFADKKACMDAKAEFAVMMAQLPIVTKPTSIQICLPQQGGEIR